MMYMNCWRFTRNKGTVDVIIFYFLESPEESERIYLYIFFYEIYHILIMSSAKVS